MVHIGSYQWFISGEAGDGRCEVWSSQDSAMRSGRYTMPALPKVGSHRLRLRRCRFSWAMVMAMVKGSGLADKQTNMF